MNVGINHAPNFPRSSHGGIVGDEWASGVIWRAPSDTIHSNVLDWVQKGAIGRLPLPRFLGFLILGPWVRIPPGTPSFHGLRSRGGTRPLPPFPRYPHVLTAVAAMHPPAYGRNQHRGEPGAAAVMLCDSACWHQSGGALQLHDNIRLPPLPPYYCPELNCMENAWTCLRTNKLCARMRDRYDKSSRYVSKPGCS